MNNMKITKEQVYINLQGKTKEELTDLSTMCDNVNLDGYDYLHFNTNFNEWIAFDDWYNRSHVKTEITIGQLKEILKHMENKEFDNLLNYAKSINFKVSDLSEYINKALSQEYYSELEGDEPEDKSLTLKLIDLA